MGQWKKGRLHLCQSLLQSLSPPTTPYVSIKNIGLDWGKRFRHCMPWIKFWMYIELCSHVWIYMEMCMFVWCIDQSSIQKFSLFPPGGHLKVPHLKGVNLKIKKKKKNPLEMENIKIHCRCGYQKHRVYTQWKCSQCYPEVREEAYTNSKLKYGHSLSHSHTHTPNHALFWDLL